MSRFLAAVVAYMRTLFNCSLYYELTREHGVYGTQSKAYTNSVLDKHSSYPGGQQVLAFHTKCVVDLRRRLSKRAQNLMKPMVTASNWCQDSTYRT